MTQLDVEDTNEDAVATDEAPAPTQASERVAALTTIRESSALRVTLSIASAFVVFALLLIANGVNPLDAYQAMWNSVTRDSNSFGDVLVRTTPYLLAALAVAVPARAGLFNIGGEGQILLGAIGALAMADMLGGAVPRSLTLLLMAVAAMAAAALWAGIAVALRGLAGTSETISTLLLNYLAFLFLGWLVFGPWKDPGATGFPRSRIFTDDERLPILFGRVHIGLLVAVGAAVLVWALLKWSPWGFRLGVLGRNSEAARRAGFRTGRLAASALMFGGALAGLAGMLQVTGVEGQLRPQMMVGYGFIGVLASWMVKHHPLRAIASSALLAAIATGGNGLKIQAGLSSASVNILMALLLLAVLGWGTRPKVRT
jgi:simple sugar transport system permease protein